MNEAGLDIAQELHWMNTWLLYAAKFKHCLINYIQEQATQLWDFLPSQQYDDTMGHPVKKQHKNLSILLHIHHIDWHCCCMLQIKNMVHNLPTFCAAPALQTASETPRMALAPSLPTKSKSSVVLLRMDIK